MRALLLVLPILLAACRDGAEEANDAAQAQPAPAPTGPPPQTPVTNVAAPPGDTAPWLDPRDNAGDPRSAPYANLLDQPVVDAPRR